MDITTYTHVIGFHSFLLNMGCFATLCMVLGAVGALFFWYMEEEEEQDEWDNLVLLYGQGPFQVPAWMEGWPTEEEEQWETAPTEEIIDIPHTWYEDICPSGPTNKTQDWMIEEPITIRSLSSLGL